MASRSLLTDSSCGRASLLNQRKAVVVNLVRWNDQTWLPVDELESMQEMVRLNVRTETMLDGRLYATVAEASEFLQQAAMNGAKHAESILLEIRAACVRFHDATEPARRQNAAWDQLLAED